MKKIQTFILAAGILFGGASFALATPLPAAAVDALGDICAEEAKLPNSERSFACKDENRNDNAGDVVKTVINTLLFITGALSVVMIIVGGMRYTLSRGDAANISSAKNTILYAVVGLIVASVAFAIVNWVLAIV